MRKRVNEDKIRSENRQRRNTQSGIDFAVYFVERVGYVGQVVACTFEVADKIDKDAAASRLADALIEAFDMSVDELVFVAVDFIFVFVHFIHLDVFAVV